MRSEALDLQPRARGARCNARMVRSLPIDDLTERTDSIPRSCRGLDVRTSGLIVVKRARMTP